MMAMIELDTKHNSRFESGFRFGYDAFIAQASNCYGAYDNFVAGYGLRYYFDDRVSPEINFHSFKRYVLADGILSLANKNKDLDNTIVSPRNLLGIGLKVGAGLEYVFGPLSSGFVDLEYLIMNTRVSGDSFPASGLIASFGVRIEK
jgi:hypothetical protein